MSIQSIDHKSITNRKKGLFGSFSTHAASPFIYGIGIEYLIFTSVVTDFPYQ